MNDTNEAEELQFQEACKLVERRARSIGPDCEIIFTKKGVQVAPLSWSVDITAGDLYAALTQADKERDSG